MAATTLAAILNTPISELRSAPTERILIIENTACCGKFSCGFPPRQNVVDVVPDAVCGLESLRQGVPAAVIVDLPRPGSSECDVCKKIADS
jgi:DNA-binding response OmpR family regulator